MNVQDYVVAIVNLPTGTMFSGGEKRKVLALFKKISKNLVLPVKLLAHLLCK